MANISKIKISGTSYNLKDENACKVVELTQAQYDDLPTTAKTSNSLFVITDATAGDLSNYYTKTETDGLLDTKLDVTAYTPTDLSNYYTKSETSGATEISTALASKADTATTYTKTETDNAITAATSTKQDTLVSGTNIKTINGETLLGEGNITIQGGSGGGKAIEAGTNISITTGETADTINCTLNVKNGTNGGIIVGDSECKSSGLYAISLGHSSYASGPYSFCNGSNSSAKAQMSFVCGNGCSSEINNDLSFMFGFNNKSTKRLQFSYGQKLKPKNELEFSFGKYNNSSSASTTFGHSGNTLFSIGNGYDFSSTHNWHNAFEVRQNGDIYIANTNDTSITGDKAYSLYPMVRLQDTITATASNTTALGGLKLVKLTQSEYDSLTTKDNSTLYVIVN